LNLKQAARHLGVHYQTAYKLVRSGRLAAVCVGARYEISEAAIERYLAERQAMRRAPARTRLAPTAASDDPFAPAELALDAVAMSANTVSELTADALATVLGDLAVVREISHDSEWFLPAVVRHADPVRRATVTATLGEFPMAVQGSGVLQTVARGSSVLKALVAQDCVHNRVDPEALQYFDEAGIHSMIVVPAFADDDVVGLVAVTRDAPGRPYTPVDLVTAERAAALVGAGIPRARLTSESWARRRSLVVAVSSLIDAGASGPPEQTMVSSGRLAEFVCDAKGRIVSANEAGGRLVGVPVVELVGRRLPDLVAEATRAEHVLLMERLLRGELNYVDARIRLERNNAVDGDADDEKVDPTAIRLAVVRDAQAQPRAIVAVAHPLPTP
jgi:excisionase family DNA binding protein/PAS domain S-box-containing protein